MIVIGNGRFAVDILVQSDGEDAFFMIIIYPIVFA